VKIKEVVNEAWGFGQDPKTGRAKGVLGRLASELVGPENYASTANFARDKLDKYKMKNMAAAATARTPAELAATVKDELPDTVDQMLTHTEPENKFLKQFELVDNDPATITYKNSTFQRDEHGKWIDFNTGKEVATRISQTLDRVSPPEGSTGTSTAPAATQLPAGAIATQPPAPQKPAVWRSNRPAAPAAPTEPAPAAPAAPTRKLPHFGKNADGSIIVTDKQNAKWTKPTGQQYWADERGAIYRPGSEQYEKLEASLPVTMKKPT
jgi:hypothetical protein